MKIKLPIKAISVNKCWQGRRFKTKDYKGYEHDVSLLLPKNERVEGFLTISIRFGYKNWKMTDTDNGIKPLMDILVKNGIIEDDRKVMKYIVEKVPSKTDWIEVGIEHYDICKE